MSIAVDLNQMKKQASFFFRDKIRTARLALTDVTPIQLLTEEATNGYSSAPDAKTMRLISRASFEVDDYLRIVGILHRRLAKFEKKQWREPYNSLVLLDHLLTHGPERIADEFQNNKETIEKMNKFQYIDEKGFNWGLVVKKKSERVLKLLEKGSIFREEREKCRKISRGIQGFGSITQNSKNNSNLNFDKNSDFYGRSISRHEDYSSKEDQKENLNSNLDLNSQIEDERIEFTEVKENEPFLAQKEDKKINEFKKMDHPFGFESNESMLLLSQG
ncbi:hypothetical protein LUZ60_015282 [Juncus effusus]|nr:hypothetical protein LUZ60_015282 [Juncus effusus]